MAKKLTNKDVDRRLEGRGITRLGDYVRAGVKLTFGCGTCSHQWAATPGSVLCGGRGCPNCAHAATSVRQAVRSVCVGPVDRKTCQRCKSEKHLSNFSRLTSNKVDGHQPKCKECKRELYITKARANGVSAQKYNNPDAEEKRCTRCHVEKPVDLFTTDNRTTDGKGSWCSECANASANNRNRAKGMKEFHRMDCTKNGRLCSKCKTYLPWGSFYSSSNPEAPNGKLSKCKTCTQADSVRYRIAHPDWARAIGSLYRDKRRKSKPDWLSPDQMVEIVEIYKERDHLTERTGVEHEVDHIVPIMGKNICGLTVPWNLEVVTKSANRKKSNKVVTGREFAA